MPTEGQLQAGFSLGDWDIYPETGVIRCGDTEVSPEPQTWRVLIALAKRDGGLVTRDDLVNEVWGGRAVSDDPINRAIREVRKCFNDSAREPLFVATLSKRGYRLLQPVRLHQASTPEPVVASGPPIASNIRRWTILILVVVGIGVGIGLLWKPAPPKSIAILPFENMSGIAGDEYLALGFKEVLVTSLAGIDGMTVKSVRVDYSEEPDTIADMLGVESILQGAMRRSGDELRVSFHISEGEKGVTHSDEVIGSVNELFATQEALAAIVRERLIGKTPQTLITSRPSDSKAYDSYMRGMHALQHRGDGQNLESAIQLFADAIRLDESFGPSYLGLATAYALMPDYRRGMTEREPGYWNSLAIETVDAGVAKDPIIAGAAGSIYGFVHHKRKRWSESEAAHHKAVNASVVDSNAFNWYSRMLASVGRMDDALEMALLAVEVDPSSAVINSRIAIMYTWLEDSERAHEYFQRANDLGADGATHLLAYAFLLAREDQLEQAKNVTVASIRKGGGSTEWIDPVFDAFEDPAKTSAALAAIENASRNKQLAPQVDLTVRTLFGDIGGAMQIAKLLQAEGEIFEMELLFVPELNALREHSDFMPLLGHLGITEYWAASDCEWRGDRLVCNPD